MIPLHTKWLFSAAVAGLVVTSLASAQTAQQDAQQRGWRKVTDPLPSSSDQSDSLNQSVPPANLAPSRADSPYPTSFPPSAYPDGTSNQDNQPPQSRGQQQYQYPAPNGSQSRDYRGAAVPPELVLRPGTFITVRVNNPLSSDHNQQGDAFSATLSKPLVVDGVVIARAGETVAGRVTEAQKAGRVSGASRLGVQLTELTLVDGTQVPLQSDLMTRNGRTSVGNDVGAIGATTAVGAAIGAAADWGRGAAIGAGAGAAAGIIGVLLTRGQQTVIYPESLLTFRIGAPITIHTDRAPQAFRYARESDYQNTLQPRTPPPARYAYGPGARPYYGSYPYAYGPAGIWGPTFGVYVGPRYRSYRRW